MASKGAAAAALPSGDAQPKSKSRSKSKSSSKSKSEPKSFHNGDGGSGGGGGEKKKPTSNPKPQQPDLRKPSSDTPKSPSKPPAVSMAGDRSPDAGKALRKRKIGDTEPFSSPSKPSNDGSGAGTGKGRATDVRASYQDDCITILRAAIDFRKRSGSLPTQSQISQIYKSVEGSLHAEMSEKQVWNRLRTLRANLKNPAGNAHAGDSVRKLALELWSHNIDEKQEYKKEKKKDDAVAEKEEDDKRRKKAKTSDKEKEESEKKSFPLVLANGGGSSALVEDQSRDQDMDEEEEEDPEEQEDGDEVNEEKAKLGADKGKGVAKEQLQSVLQAYPYLVRAAEKNWKKQGLPELSLLEGLKVDAAKAKTLDDKWKKHIDEEMKFQAEHSKVDREILELMSQIHRKLK